MQSLGPEPGPGVSIDVVEPRAVVGPDQTAVAPSVFELVVGSVAGLVGLVAVVCVVERVAGEPVVVGPGLEGCGVGVAGESGLPPPVLSCLDLPNDFLRGTRPVYLRVLRTLRPLVSGYWQHVAGAPVTDSE